MRHAAAVARRWGAAVGRAPQRVERREEAGLFLAGPVARRDLRRLVAPEVHLMQVPALQARTPRSGCVRRLWAK